MSERLAELDRILRAVRTVLAEVRRAGLLRALAVATAAMVCDEGVRHGVFVQGPVERASGA
jgi:hypothetical protein